MKKILSVNQEEVNLNIDILKTVIIPQYNSGKFGEINTSDEIRKYCVIKTNTTIMSNEHNPDVFRINNFLKMAHNHGYEEILLLYESIQKKSI